MSTKARMQRHGANHAPGGSDPIPGGLTWANAGAGCSEPLYHLQLGGPGYDVETIDPATGAVTASTPGMTGDGTQILAATWTSAEASLVRLSIASGGDSALATMVRATGVITEVAIMFGGAGEFLDALAWIGGTLYGARGGSTATDLYTIDPATGAATSVGPVGYAIDALAYDATTGTLYGATTWTDPSNPSELLTVDPATGAGTLVGPFGGAVGQGVSDLAVDSAGFLYGWDADVGGLVSIAKASGSATSVAVLTSNYGGGLFFASSSTASSGTFSELEIGARLNVVDIGGGVIRLEACRDGLPVPPWTVDYATGEVTGTTGDPNTLTPLTLSGLLVKNAAADPNILEITYAGFVNFTTQGQQFNVDTQDLANPPDRGDLTLYAGNSLIDAYGSLDLQVTQPDSDMTLLVQDGSLILRALIGATPGLGRVAVHADEDVRVEAGANVQFNASGDVLVVLASGQKLTVTDSFTNPIFEVREDGSLHGLTGQALTFDL